MKTLNALFILIAVSSCSYGQSLTPQVISSYGNFSSAGGNSLSATGGELAVTTLSAASHFLTQGFQQPNDASTYVVQLNNNQLTIEVYPNPTADNATVTVKGTNLDPMSVTLFDLLGREIMTAGNTQKSKEVQVFTMNLSSLPAAIYFIRVTDTAGHEYRTIKINKIN